jgi:hypothetical protein
MKEIDYTSKMLVIIGIYERIINDEVNCFCCLLIAKQSKQKWAGTNNRPPKLIWADDMLSKMNGIGKKTYENLEASANWPIFLIFK